MKSLLPFLALSVLTGCTVGVAAGGADEAEGRTGESASAVTTLTLPPGSVPPQLLFPAALPKLPPPKLTFSPPAGTCPNTQNRYAILAAECDEVPGAGGDWSARTVFASGEKAVCEMRWRPDRILSVARPDLAALGAFAQQEPELVRGTPAPALLRPLCDATAICNPSVTSCTVRTPMPPPALVPVKGMGGCSSCAFLVGDTVYAVLPHDYAADVRLTIDIAGQRIFVDPGGAQTFTVDVSHTAVIRRDGFVRVER